jgi:hypothetical protein
MLNKIPLINLWLRTLPILRKNLKRKLMSVSYQAVLTFSGNRLTTK